MILLSAISIRNEPPAIRDMSKIVPRLAEMSVTRQVKEISIAIRQFEILQNVAAVMRSSVGS